MWVAWMRASFEFRVPMGISVAAILKIYSGCQSSLLLTFN
jgi:hypothetical protein